jgi:hypothetical protein
VSKLLLWLDPIIYILYLKFQEIMGMEIEVTMAAQGEETLISDKESKATAASIPAEDNSDPIVRTAEMETAKMEGNTEVAKSSILPPKDASDEWGTPKQIHTFYLPKVRMMEDPKVKTKLDQLHKTMNNNKAQKGNLLSQLADKRVSFIATPSLLC